ncbi:MAG: hypothetical protein ABSE73_01545 [Planctomycetota bacterium]
MKRNLNADSFANNLPSGRAKRTPHEWVKRLCKPHSFDLYICDPEAETVVDLWPFVKRTALIGKGTRREGRWLEGLRSLSAVKNASEEIAA